MNMLTKNLLAGLAVGSLALGGAVFADDDKEVQVKHKIIEINADSDSDVNIVVAGDGHDETISMTFDEMKDEYILEERLAHLDEDMRNTIMSALSGVKTMKFTSDDGNSFFHDVDKKVVVMHGGDGGLTFANTVGDADFDFEFLSDDGDAKVRKHIVIGDASHVLKGHTDAIVRLIEKGEFTQDELDKIQSAIDVKR
jgi:hypothetical protein